MTNEILESIELADEVLESAEHDPFGLNIITEGKLDSLNPDDLQTEDGVNKLRAQIAKVNSIRLALSIWSKLTWLAAAGGAAAGVATAADTDGKGLAIGGIISLISLISGKIARMVSNHMKNKQESELIYVSKTIGTTVERLKRKVGTIQDEKRREAIEDQITKAENLKNQVDTILKTNEIGRAKDQTKAIRRMGTATYVDAAL